MQVFMKSSDDNSVRHWSQISVVQTASDFLCNTCRQHPKPNIRRFEALFYCIDVASRQVNNVDYCLIATPSGRHLCVLHWTDVTCCVSRITTCIYISMLRSCKRIWRTELIKCKPNSDVKYEYRHGYVCLKIMPPCPYSGTDMSALTSHSGYQKDCHRMLDSAMHCHRMLYFNGRPRMANEWKHNSQSTRLNQNRLRNRSEISRILLCQWFLLISQAPSSCSCYSCPYN